MNTVAIVEDIYAREPVEGSRDGAVAGSRVRFEKFLKAIRDLPPPPCVGCPHRRRCATQELACEQFWQYAHAGPGERPWPGDTPPTREPNKAIFTALNEDDTDSRRQRIRPRRAKSKRHPRLPLVRVQVVG